MLVVKYIKHILVAIYVHIYCFLTVPGETQTHFLRNTYLIIFYVLLMIYLWISVLQIRSGCAVWSASYRSYPTKDQYIEKVVSLDFTMKPYMINMWYRMIPFLYELNCLIDCRSPTLPAIFGTTCVSKRSATPCSSASTR